MVDDHLQVHDEGVAFLFDEDKELLVEVIKEEPKVRATVPSATQASVQSLYRVVEMNQAIISLVV